MSPEYQKWLDDLYEATKKAGATPSFMSMYINGEYEYTVHVMSGTDCVLRLKNRTLKELLQRWEDEIVKQTGRGTGSQAALVPSKSEAKRLSRQQVDRS